MPTIEELGVIKGQPAPRLKNEYMTPKCLSECLRGLRKLPELKVVRPDRGYAVVTDITSGHDVLVAFRFRWGFLCRILPGMFDFED